jgi:hypothetical protein
VTRLRQCLTAIALVALTGPTFPAAAADMAAHRALYALSLSTARSTEVVAVTGSMAYEVIDACDGWASRQRLQLTISNRDGQDIEMVSDYVTWEAKDGLSFRFRMRQTTDTAVTSETEGDATLTKPGGPGTAHFKLPEETTKDLPAGTLFPMKHTETIIASARDGKKFLSLPLLDGTVPSGAQDTSVAITAWLQPEKISFPSLSELASNRVHIAFFDRDSQTQQPDYEVSMRYWENGVADALLMDFSDFVMAGKLTELTLLPPHC